MVPWFHPSRVDGRERPDVLDGVGGGGSGMKGMGGLGLSMDGVGRGGRERRYMSTPGREGRQIFVCMK